MATSRKTIRDVVGIFLLAALVVGVAIATTDAQGAVVRTEKTSPAGTCQAVKADTFVATVSCTMTGGQWFRVRVNSTLGSPQSITWMLTCGFAKVSLPKPVLQLGVGTNVLMVGPKSLSGPEHAASLLLQNTTQPCAVDIDVEPWGWLGGGAWTNVSWGIDRTAIDKIDIWTTT